MPARSTAPVATGPVSAAGTTCQRRAGRRQATGNRDGKCEDARFHGSHPIVLYSSRYHSAMKFGVNHRRRSSVKGYGMHLARDLRYGWRGLARSPIFTLVALTSIALGTGVNTAIFTLIDEVLLQLLPVKNPEQLILLTGPRNHYGSNSGGNVLSFPMYEDVRDNLVERGGAAALPRVSTPITTSVTPTPIFSGVFARRATPINVGIRGQTERVPGELVSGTFFQTLGVGAAVGRLMTPDDDRVRDGSLVAVLSYNYWRDRFAADPAIVGRTITVNSYPFTIIGVSEAGFDGVDIGYVPSVRVPIV